MGTVKLICKGCAVAAQKRGMLGTCPFCRAPLPDSDAGKLAMVRARVEKKDPHAIHVLGQKYFFGSLGLQKDKGRSAWLD